MNVEPDPVVHPRIHQRHHDINPADVIHAWNSAIAWTARLDGSGSCIAIGFDSKARPMEMVAIYHKSPTGVGPGKWLIYHAMIPPSVRTLKELGVKDTRRCS